LNGKDTKNKEEKLGGIKLKVEGKKVSAKLRGKKKNVIMGKLKREWNNG
jgi:hypothetical protein